MGLPLLGIFQVYEYQLLTIKLSFQHTLFRGILNRPIQRNKATFLLL
jgi:hypothetical protein